MPWMKLLEKLEDAAEMLPLQNGHEIAKKREYWALRIPELILCWNAKASGIDASIRSYSRTGQWLAMSSDESLFIRWRLDRAKEVVGLLNYATQKLALSVHALEEEALFEWALIDAWDGNGAHKTQEGLSDFDQGYSSGSNERKADSDP